MFSTSYEVVFSSICYSAICSSTILNKVCGHADDDFQFEVYRSRIEIEQLHHITYVNARSSQQS